jgi:hypothetical protein
MSDQKVTIVCTRNGDEVARHQFPTAVAASDHIVDQWRQLELAGWNGRLYIDARYFVAWKQDAETQVTETLGMRIEFVEVAS